MSIIRPSELSFTHSLAYLYLTLAHHGDREGLTQGELNRILVKIREWNDQFSSSLAESIETTSREVMETWEYFRRLGDLEQRAELALHIEALRTFLPDPVNRRAVVFDLIAIAEADSDATTVEKALVVALKKDLGL